MTEPAILAHNLSRTYQVYSRGERFFGRRRSTNQIQALSDCSLEVAPGETVALLGFNGSGKSTLVKILCGLIRPDAGTVACLGYEPFRERERYVRHIGVVFGQKSLLFPDLTLADSLELYRVVYALTPAQLQTNLDLCDRYFQVRDFLHQPVRKLSLGQRMRGDLVAALFHAPPLIFLDEPSLGLDLQVRGELARFLHDRARQGQTNVIVTHDLDLVTEACDRLVILDQGVKVLDQPLRELQMDAPRVIELTYQRIYDAEVFEGICQRALRYETPHAHRLTLFVAHPEVDDTVRALADACQVVQLEVRMPPIKDIVAALLRPRGAS